MGAATGIIKTWPVGKWKPHVVAARLNAGDSNIDPDSEKLARHPLVTERYPSTLEAADNVAAQKGANITLQMSNDTNADLAQTMTQLDANQTAMQASLESGSMVMSLSLMTYLS